MHPRGYSSTTNDTGFTSLVTEHTLNANELRPFGLWCLQDISWGPARSSTYGRLRHRVRSDRGQPLAGEWNARYEVDPTVKRPRKLDFGPKMIPTVTDTCMLPSRN